MILIIAVVLRCLSYVLTFCFTVMFVVMSMPRLCKLYFKKRVTYEEPSCVNNPTLGEYEYLELSDHNLKIHYVCNGEKSKPLMLFLHGFPDFWYTWRFQLPEFGKDYFTVAVDMIGYGKSSKPEGVDKYKAQDIALYVKDVIHKLGYDDCILVGHDWGSSIAYQVAGGLLFNTSSTQVFCSKAVLKFWKIGTKYSWSPVFLDFSRNLWRTCFAEQVWMAAALLGKNLF